MTSLAPLSARPVSALWASGDPTARIRGQSTVAFVGASFGTSAFSAAGAVGGAFTNNDRSPAISGVASATFVTDNRHLTITGTTTLSPVVKGFLSSVLSGAGATATAVVAESTAYTGFAIASATDLLPLVSAFHYRTARIQGRGALNPVGSQNKNTRFVIQSSGAAAFATDGLSPRRIEIAGGSSVRFVSQREECSLRMALPFDRIKPRTFRIKAGSTFSASTDIPGGMTFSIRGKTKLVFKPLETKIRCAKMIARQRNKATFRGAYG